MKQTAIALHLPEKWRPRIRRQDVKRCTLESIGLDPTCRTFEHVRTIVVEAEHEAAIHLNTVVVKNCDPASVILRSGTLLASVSDVVRMKRLKADEHTGTSSQSHFADERRIVG